MKKVLKRNDLVIFYFIFFLICLQGLIGWYMVQSGLINNVTVSHYRLSLHLLMAFIIIGLIFWSLLNSLYLKTETNQVKKNKTFFQYINIFNIFTNIFWRISIRIRCWKNLSNMASYERKLLS